VSNLEVVAAKKHKLKRIKEELELHNLGCENSYEAGGIWMGEDLHSVEEQENHPKRPPKKMPRNKVDISPIQVSLS
jgi:hypothetical protein